jgi:hypothetical protein
MTYESLESVDLGAAEVAIEVVGTEFPEESQEKYEGSVAPYVEFDE